MLEEALIGVPGEGIHDLHKASLPLSLANKGRPLHLAVLLGSQAKVGFGSIESIPALEIAHQDEKVDLAMGSDGCIQLGEQQFIVLRC